MNTKELRLGNFINRRYWNSEPNNEKYCTEVNVVTWISPSNINVSPIISKEKFRIAKDDILPAELTEYWVRKFGFTHIENKTYIIDDGNYEVQFFDDCIRFYIAAYMDSPPSVEIKYIHELQNLYFFLSGKELKIKESCHLF